MTICQVWNSEIQACFSLISTVVSRQALAFCSAGPLKFITFSIVFVHRNPEILDELDIDEETKNVLLQNIKRRLTPQAVKIRAGKLQWFISSSSDIEVICTNYEQVNVACTNYEGVEVSYFDIALIFWFLCQISKLPVQIMKVLML
jgi:hypothetical protein